MSLRGRIKIHNNSALLSTYIIIFSVTLDTYCISNMIETSFFFHQKTQDSSLGKAKHFLFQFTFPSDYSIFFQQIDLFVFSHVSLYLLQISPIPHNVKFQSTGVYRGSNLRHPNRRMALLSIKKNFDDSWEKNEKCFFHFHSAFAPSTVVNGGGRRRLGGTTENCVIFFCISSWKT